MIIMNSKVPRYFDFSSTARLQNSFLQHCFRDRTHFKLWSNANYKIIEIFDAFLRSLSTSGYIDKETLNSDTILMLTRLLRQCILVLFNRKLYSKFHTITSISSYVALLYIIVHRPPWREVPSHKLSTKLPWKITYPE